MTDTTTNFAMTGITPTSIRPNRRWRVRPGSVTWRNVGTETVVLDLASSTYLSLNNTASELWNLVAAGGASQAMLADELAARHDLDASSAFADVETFLIACSDRGWID